MFLFLKNFLARLRLPRSALPVPSLSAADIGASNEPYRDAFGYHDPELGDLKDDWNYACWRGRMVFESGEDCDLVLLEREEDGFPDSDPRPSGLARLRDARLILESELMGRATRAVIEARMARLNWRDGPPADRWGPIQILVSKDDTLRLAIYEGETDEYSLWIVRFDELNSPVEVRRTPFIATDKTIDDVGIIV
ncbi:hypothetical protein [Oricola indica]|jgi:hypothetical protein|uniref:hypothetical protein n=1 Tax=Oricola indica TaxID=2872591 RepID=UPI001CBFFFCC|nr:hypothetical protein [Oricola indica]